MKKILMVEDDADIRLGLKIRLEASGYEALEAVTAASGIRKAKEEGPDLIILDLGLPDRSGFEVMKELQGGKRTARIPIVVLTAHGTTENLTKSLSEENIVTFLQKPVGNEELLQTIRIGLGEDGSPTPPRFEIS